MRLLACCALLVFGCLPAFAFEIISGDEASIPAGQVIEDDVVLTGQDVEVKGEVKGNVFAFGSSVVIEGPVEGSVVAAGQTVEWSGASEGSVHLAGQSVVAEGQAKRNLVVAGQSVRTEDEASAGAEIIAAGNVVTVGGTAGKDVRLVGNQVTFEGETAGPLEIVAESGRIASTAVVGGDLTSYGEKRPKIESGAQIGGTTKHVQAEAGAAKAPKRPNRVGRFLFRLVLMCVWGLVGLALAPRAMSESAANIGSRPGASVGLGFAALVCVPVAFLLLLVTVVGIPAALALLVGYLLLLMFTGPFSALWLGRRILGVGRSVVWALLLGALIIAFVTVLPFIGWIFQLAALVFGLGAGVLWVAGAIGRQRAKPGPTVPPAAPVAAEEPASP